MPFERYAKVNIRIHQLVHNTIQQEWEKIAFIEIILIKENLQFCINLAFKRSTHKYLVIYNDKAKWSVKNNDDNNCWDEELLISALNFVLDNSYIIIGNTLIRQLIGIGMGLDPAPFIANLYLFAYE